jgi:hypothetical protein
MEKQEKTITQQVDEALIKIVVLVNKINRNTEMCCFYEDVAHCGFIEIRLYNTKKEYNSTPVKFQEHYDGPDTQKRLKRLNELVSFLEKTLEEKEIDFSELCENTTEVVESYSI